MKREELEHRQRESELYSKIIELQIENANLKGDKETLCRVVSHRDKMLMEIRVQLQAMEFFCRENDIKVDIEMCSDEVIQNWSFKESDEVYQRILLTTQDLLRTASKCLEENMISMRSSSQQQQQQRSTRSSSTTSAKTLRKGTSESVQSVATNDEDAVLFKETSRPGTLKLDLQSLLRSEQEFSENKGNRSTVSHSNLAEIDAGIAERDGRRALDGGDHRSTFFRASSGDEDDSFDEEDDGDDSQESEFEELGEDMIKYVELQPSMGPRRESRSSSFSRMTAMSPYCGSYVGTPDMSTAVLMKNLWSGGAAKRSSATTPSQHPSYQYQHQQQLRRGSAKRSSGGSLHSNGSLVEDYFTKLHPCDQASPYSTPAQPTATPIGLGLGLGIGMSGIGRSPEQISMERFLPAPPAIALPPIPTPQYSPRLPLSSSPPSSHHHHSYGARSPLSKCTSAVFISSSPLPMDSSKRSSTRSNRSTRSNSSVTRSNPPPPPVIPLPPLPTYRTISYREQAKQELVESKRPSRSRVSSHGYVIQKVDQFLERKTYGKLLARDLMHRGHQRRTSV
ncbi:hypothetical protein BGX26_012581 [Mortierella sp. AD094]|nr:hypothetical protein BGX26_012581 [Mortierella sp. AD094]